MPRLHEAVVVGNLEMVKRYLSAGDDVNMFSYVMLNARSFYSFFSTAERFKMTPLHLAVHINNSEMVDLLLEKDASLTIGCSVNNDHAGFAAVEIAIIREHRDLAIKLLHLSDKDVKNRLIDNLTPAQKKDFLDLESDELDDLDYCFNEFLETGRYIKTKSSESNIMLVDYNISNNRKKLEHLLFERATSEALKKEYLP